MQYAFKLRLTADDYLSGELTSELRREYVDGEVYAMAGAGEPHNLIALNVASFLRNHVRGGPCRVFISDMKLHVVTWKAFYYPDVMVVCDAGDAQTDYKQSPCLVVEVLSPSTESIDRREKMLAYRTLPSLSEYLLIAQENASLSSTGAPTMATGFWPNGQMPVWCSSLASTPAWRLTLCMKMSNLARTQRTAKIRYRADII